VQTKGLSDDEFIDDREFTEELGFREFLDQVENGGMKYMRFSPVLEQFPELLNDFDRRFLRDMPGRFSFGTTFQAFIGGPRTFTRMHNAPTPFFFVNVCGVKRWVMIPNRYLAVLDPPAEGRGYNHSDADVGRADPRRFPGFESIDRFEVRIEPGDVLYVPSWMWHSVQNDSATIGVRCGFVYPKKHRAGVADPVSRSRLRCPQSQPPAGLLLFAVQDQSSGAGAAPAFPEDLPRLKTSVRPHRR
jgi:hypothetical protein